MNPTSMLSDCQTMMNRLQKEIDDLNSSISDFDQIPIETLNKLSSLYTDIMMLYQQQIDTLSV
jgi:CII-binding regulator of phage lambda lysogenization HflD